MSSTATKGRSAIFWILVVLGVSCAGCSALTVGLMGLGLLAGDERPASSGTAAPRRSGSALPTGNTPDLFPGMPGWLPSGRGVSIPAAEVSDERPVGLWWTGQLEANGTMIARRVLFLSDGTRASNPRPGGGDLFDLEGQRAQRGNTGLGTFEVEDGVISEHVEGINTRNPFRSGNDGEGPWFEISATRYRPLTPPTDADLVGTWKGPGVKYVFRAEGTVVAAGAPGTWVLDGYLLQLSPSGAPGWITTVGLTGNDLLVVGPSVCKRE